MYPAPTEANPVTGLSHEQVMRNEPVDCCENPDYTLVNIENKGNRAEATFECESCQARVTEVFTIRRVEREDGEVFEANKSSYGDDDSFNVVWVGKTSPSTLEFVAEGTDSGLYYSDVYKYYGNEY
jgi:hypothetical protein